MTLSTLPQPAGSPQTPYGDHPAHGATAALQKALHESRRAALGREYDQERGIHRLSSSPAPAAEAPPENLAFFKAYLGVRAGRGISVTPPSDAGAPAAEDNEGEDATQRLVSQSELRGLIHDFKERQHRDARVVARSIAAAIALTVIGLILLVASATAGRADTDESALRPASQSPETARLRGGA